MKITAGATIIARVMGEVFEAKVTAVKVSEGGHIPAGETYYVITGGRQAWVRAHEIVNVHV